MCDLDKIGTCKQCEDYGICPHSWDEYDEELKEINDSISDSYKNGQEYSIDLFEEEGD